MSKNLLGGIFAGIVAIAGIGYGLYFKGFLGNSAPEILSYVPDQFDQFVYINVDEDVVNYLSGQAAADGATGDFQAIAKTIDDMVMYQYSSGEIFYSLLFVKDAGGFSIEKAKTLGLIMPDANYTSKNLSKNVLVYGETESLAFLDTAAPAKVSKNPDLIVWFKGLRDHNVGFVSRPAPGSAAMMNPMVAQFANKLKYTQVLSQVGKNMAGTIRMLFDGDVLPDLKSSFSPQLLSQAASGSTMVAELHNLMSLFGMTKESFSSLAALGLGQANPALSALIKSEQYGQLFDMLNSPVMIEMQPAPSMVGMSIRLSFAKGGLYPVVKDAAPVLAGLFSSIIGSGNVQTEQTSGEVAFMMTVPLLPQMDENGVVMSGAQASGDVLQNIPGLRIREQNGGEVVTLFDADWKSVAPVSFGSVPSNTIAVFQSKGGQGMASMFGGLPMVDSSTGEVVSQGSLSIEKRNTLLMQFKTLK